MDARLTRNGACEIPTFRSRHSSGSDTIFDQDMARRMAELNVEYSHIQVPEAGKYGKTFDCLASARELFKPETEHEDDIVRKFSDALGHIKPATLITFVGDMKRCTNAAERVNKVIVLLEAYGWYWNTVSTISFKALDALCWGIEKFTDEYMEHKSKLTTWWDKKTHVPTVAAEEMQQEMTRQWTGSDTDDSDLQNHAGELPVDFSELFSGTDKYLTASDKATLSRLSPVLQLAIPLAFVGSSLLGLTNPGARATKVMKMMSESLKSTNTIGNNFKELRSIIKNSFAHMLEPEKFSFKADLARDIIALNADLDKYSRELQELQAIAVNTERMNEMTRVYDKIAVLYEQLLQTKEKDMATLNIAFQSLMRKYKAVYDEYFRLRTNTVCRQEPVCIWLFGQPGTGKSYYVNHLTMLLSKIEKTQLSVYTRNCLDDYTSGYCGQPIYVYDDFGQSKTGAEVCEFTAVKGCNTHRLNMAELENKGTPFTSKYIIVCSNTPGIGASDVILDSGAFDRRRDLMFHVENANAVNHWMRAGEADPSDYKSDFSHLTLTRINPVKQQDGTYLPIQDLIDWTPMRVAHKMFELQKVYEEKLLKRMQELANINVDVDDPGLDLKRQVDYNQWARDHQAELKPRTLDKGRPIQQQQQQQPRQQHQRGGQHQYLGPQGPNWRQGAYFGGVREDLLMRMADDYQFHGDETILTVREKARKAYLIVGEPGLGKTRLLDILRTKIGEVGRQREYLFFDEFLNDSTDEALTAVWDTYSKLDAPTPILVTNTRLLTAEKIEEHGRMLDAFLRRCVLFEVRKGFFANLMEKVRDTTDFSAVKWYRRERCEVKSDRNVLEQEVVEEILKRRRLEADVVVDYTPKKWNKRLPERRVVMCDPVVDFGAKSLKEITQAVLSGKCQHYGMQTLDRVSLGYTLLRECGDLAGKPAIAAMTAANERNVPWCLDPVALVFMDQTIVCAAEDKKLRFYYEQKDNQNIIRKANEELEKVELTEKERVSGVMKFIDGLFLLLQFGAALGLSINYTYRCFNKTRCEEIEEMENEGWGDEPYEEDDTVEVPEWAKLPKSVRSKARVMDYCKSCHSSNCEHCIAYINEAYETTIRRRAPRRVKAPTDGEDIRNEARGKALGSRLLTKKPTKRVQHLMDSANTRELNIIRKNSQPTTLLTVDKIPNLVREDRLLDDADLEDEAMVDPGASNLIQKFADNVLYYGTPDHIIQRAVGVRGKIVVLNAHAVGDRRRGDKLPFFYNQGDEIIQCTGTLMNFSAYRDIAIVEMDKQCKTFADIVKHMPTKAEDSNYNGVFGWLVYNFPDKTRQVVNVVLNTQTEVRVADVKRYGIKYNGHAAGVEYAPINSEKGRCGSMVIVTNTGFPHKLIGIHSAASATTGIGALLFQDDFEHYSNHANQEEDEVENESLETIVDNIRILSHQCVGKIEPKRKGYFVVVGVPYDYENEELLEQFQMRKTRYWDSPLALEEKKMEPGIMSNFDPRAPYDFMPFENGVEKYNHDQPEMDLELLDNAIDSVGDYLAYKLRENCKILKVLTKTEAVNGVTLYDSSNPLRRDSSAGFPWKHFVSGAKKEDFFELDPEMLIWRIRKNDMGKRLTHAIDSIIQACRQGFRTAVVNVATLKDEPRKLKRIYQEPDTRVFWAAPLDKVMADRMYFHAATAALADIHAQIPIKIGLNPYGIGFHKLYTWHSRVSDAGFDMDATGWDNSVPVAVMERLYKIWNRIYEVNDPDCSADDQRIRQYLHRHLVRPLVMYYNYVVQLPGGNISGQSMTGIDNSIINMVYHYYIWLVLCKEQGRRYWANFDAFMANVALSVYGDDAIDTVSPRAMDFYTPQNYIRVAATFGIKITPADKLSGAEVTFKPLRKLEFLKRNFIKQELPNGMPSGMWTGALQEDSFHKMLDFVACKKPHHYYEDEGVINFDMCTIAQVIEVALLEACAYGRKRFYILLEHLIGRCSHYGIRVPKWPSYVSCYNIIWQTGLSEDSPSLYEIDFHDHANDYNDMSGVQPAVVGEPGAPVASAPPSSAPSTMSREQAGADRNSSSIGFTGDTGMLPYEVYEKDICIGNITWASTQNAGTILYQAPVSPSGANAYVQYFSAPFNAWAGGLIFSIQVCGTGFNGGKIIILHMPPNYKPNNAIKLDDLTVFPYKEIDVKESGAITTIAYDERNIMFHWRSTDPGSIDSFGGWFVVAVLSPLISSNGGNTSVNLLLFSKPALSFRVSQLMPLQTISEIPGDIASAQAMFPGPTVPVLCPYSDTVVTSWTVHSMASVPTITQGTYGQVNGGGTPWGRAYQRWDNQPLAGNTTTNGLFLFGDSTQTSALRPLRFVTGSLAVGGQSNNTYTSLWTNPTAPFGAQLGDAAALGNGGTYDLLNLQAQLGLMPNQPCANILNGSNTLTVIPDPNYNTVLTPAIGGESIVSFDTDIQLYQTVSTLNATQTTAHIQALTTGVSNKVITAGQALLFLVVDTVTKLPVGYLKFYYSGFFTTAGSTVTTVYKYNQFKFIPTQIIDDTQPIPNSTELITNKILVDSTLRRRMNEDQIVEKVVTRLVTATPRPESASGSRVTVRSEQVGSLDGGRGTPVDRR